VVTLKEKKEKKKNKGITIGLIGLIVVMSLLVIIINFDAETKQEPRYIVEILNEDPKNY